ncbi:MAG: hypothetical protein AB7T49_19375 [Oligoflexales bacterium]
MKRCINMTYSALLLLSLAACKSMNSGSEAKGGAWRDEYVRAMREEYCLASEPTAEVLLSKTWKCTWREAYENNNTTGVSVLSFDRIPSDPDTLEMIGENRNKTVQFTRDGVFALGVRGRRGRDGFPVMFFIRHDQSKNLLYIAERADLNQIPPGLKVTSVCSGEPHGVYGFLSYEVCQ